VERMHLPDTIPDNHVETTFSAEGDGTLMRIRMTLPDAQTCRAMIETGMEGGMEASYVRLVGSETFDPLHSGNSGTPKDSFAADEDRARISGTHTAGENDLAALTAS
jgi:hypothetical protein